MLKYKKYLVIPILLILICVIFYPVIFQGKIFSSPDSLNPKAATIILENSQKETGEYPLWQPWIFSGMPTAESFTNTSNLYFPQFVFNLLKFSPIFIHLMHFLFAGIGMYILLRYLKISQFVAIIGAAGFMLMPYLITMEVFGHGSQAMTAAYIPWVFWSALRLFDKQKLLDAGLLAIILGLQLQRAHVQIAYYTWMLIGALFLYKIILYLIDKENRRQAAKVSGLFIVGVLLALGISALVYLPSMQYSSESIRSVGQAGSASYEYATSWSFHPKEMLTFLIPSAYGFGGQTYWGKMPFTDYPNYMGTIFLILAVVALIKNREKLVWFLAGTTILALLISFGSHFSLIYNIFYGLAPYFNKFRIPSMILILVQFNVIILACIGFEKLLDNDWKEVPKWYWWLAGFIAFPILILLFGNGLLYGLVSNEFTQPRTQDPRVVELINNLRWDNWLNDAWMFVVFISGLIGSLYLLIKGKINKVGFAIIVGILAIVDLAIVDNKIVLPEENSGRSSQLISKKAIERYFEHDAVTQYLVSIDDKFRVYPIGPLFGESRLQAFGIESVGGYHPAKLAIYNRFLQNTDNISTLPIMKMMNVHYILSRRAVNHPDLKLVFTENMQTGSGRIPIWVYQLTDAIPRAWFAKNVETVEENGLWNNLIDESFDPLKTAYITESIEDIKNGNSVIQYSKFTPNNILINTKSDTDGFLVISEVHYPLRWKAFIDDESVDTYEVNGIIRGLVVSPGEHTIEFKYDKTVFNKGLLIAIISTIFALGLIGVSFIKIKK